MASKITLKRRITSVRNTRQITKAMELVSASKMRRAQERAKSGRAYRQAAHSLLARLSTLTDVAEHPLYQVRPVKRRLYIVITSNSGLAGAYNANIIKLFTRLATTDRDAGIDVDVITVGTIGAQFVRRLETVTLSAAYPAFGDAPSANDIRPLLDSVTERFRENKIDDVKLLFTDLKSNIVQTASVMALLPARLEDNGDVTGTLATSTFEPDIMAVLDNVTERLLEVQLWQAMLESIASEHSMRMMAMKNATDNASELIDDLTLAFNTARQAAITQELAEITGGAEAIK